MKKRFSLRDPQTLLIGLGLLGIIFMVFWNVAPREADPVEKEEFVTDASRLMARAVEAVRDCRKGAEIPIDGRTDLNRTGLVGLESSPITTSLGQLEAKRTTVNPAFAGAVVRMLREAGVERGDVVAVGASSSFPGLIVATLCAAQAMGVRALPIVSLGASNWGGNDPRWTGIDILDCLNGCGVLDVGILALSIGGEGDTGRDMTAEGRELLRRRIEAAGTAFIEERGLVSDVAARMRLFEAYAGVEPIKAFINIGGSWVNMGTDSEVLKLQPGFNPASAVTVPPVGRRGLIQEWAARGIPVIHLLYVKGLCDRYGLPWDPVPLPDPTAGTDSSAPNGSIRPWLAGLAVLFLAAGLILIRLRRLSGLTD